MGVDVKTVDKAVSFSGEWQAPAAASGPTLKASDTESWMAVNRAWKVGNRVWRDSATGDFSLTSRRLEGTEAASRGALSAMDRQQYG
jgi:hypothetical protein